MSRRLALVAAGLLGINGLAAAGTSVPGSVTVNATDVIYDAGQSSAASEGGTVPQGIISISGDDYITFSSVTGSLMCGYSEGCITLNSGGSLNDPDGVGAGTGQSSNTGANAISGLTAPDAGYLTGVFLDGTIASGPTPTALDFTSGGIGTSFTSLTPVLDQAFFIGDGLTGDGTGTAQTFYVPAGATELVLGISDAGGYNGSPGSYGDNSGAYTVNFALDQTTTSATPEPASVLMLLGGIGMLALKRYNLTR